METTIILPGSTGTETTIIVSVKTGSSFAFPRSKIFTLPSLLRYELKGVAAKVYVSLTIFASADCEAARIPSQPITITTKIMATLTKMRTSLKCLARSRLRNFINLREIVLTRLDSFIMVQWTADNCIVPRYD